jgi:hypothetical protein
MPIEAGWLDQSQAILIYRFIEFWNAAELHTAVDQVAQLVQDPPHRLDVISDMSMSKGMARGSAHGDMQAAVNRSYRVLPEDAFHLAIVVGGGRVLDLMINVSAKVYMPLKKHVRTATTIDEALQMIATDRAAALSS